MVKNMEIEIEQQKNEDIENKNTSQNKKNIDEKENIEF